MRLVKVRMPAFLKSVTSCISLFIQLSTRQLYITMFGEIYGIGNGRNDYWIDCDMFKDLLR